MIMLIIILIIIFLFCKNFSIKNFLDAAVYIATFSLVGVILFLICYSISNGIFIALPQEYKDIKETTYELNIIPNTDVYVLAEYEDNKLNYVIYSVEGKEVLNNDSVNIRYYSETSKTPYLTLIETKPKNQVIKDLFMIKTHKRYEIYIPDTMKINIITNIQDP